MTNQEENKISVLMFLLEHNKFQQLVKVGFNLAISQKLLIEYGDLNYGVRLTER